MKTANKKLTSQLQPKNAKASKFCPTPQRQKTQTIQTKKKNLQQTKNCFWKSRKLLCPAATTPPKQMQ